MYAITSESHFLSDQAQAQTQAHWGISFGNVGGPDLKIKQIRHDHRWLVRYESLGRTTLLQQEAQWQVEHLKGLLEPSVLTLTQSIRDLYRGPTFITLRVAAFTVLPLFWLGLDLPCGCTWVAQDIHVTLGSADVQEEIKTSP